MSSVNPLEEAALPQSHGLSYAVDTTDKREWHEIVQLFDDAAIHQTWSWGALRWGPSKLSHLLVYNDRRIVAAAQVITLSVPVIGGGIAHCKFGPMWRLRDQAERLDVYNYTMHVMREVYAKDRGLLLRVKPWEVDDTSGSYRRARANAGLRERPGDDAYNTFVVDTSRSLEELRAGFASKWRYNLKKAEKRRLEVKQSIDREAAEIFMQSYIEMRQIKSYEDHSEVAIFRELMDDLPPAMRPTVFTVMIEGKPAASIVVSHLGRVAYYLFGATAKAGRDSGAAYLLFWEASRPDTPNGRHGYRQFKSGIVGKSNGFEVNMKDWEACSALRSRLVVSGGDWFRNKLPARDFTARNPGTRKASQ
jgi:hypothetical protein